MESLLAEEPTRVSVGKAEEFFVDDFLDLSKEEDDDNEEEEEEEEEEEDSPAMAVSEEKKSDFENDHGGFILKDEYCNTTTTTTTTTKAPGNELSIPADDLADLEWLSHFVEDSFSEYSLPYTAAGGTLPPEKVKRPSEPEPEPRWCAGPIPAKARSRRGRHGGGGWSAGCLSGGGGESSSSSASSSSSTSGTPASLPWLTNGSFYMIKKEPVLKKAKGVREEGETGGGGGGRRCSHCLVQKTPQWRAGPKGAKTLCNACGVRYKSGRLLPEYRPACSPTFSSDLHSNNHRKVMEMRRRKETATAAPVWSF